MTGARRRAGSHADRRRSVLGGGLAGVACAQQLGDEGVQVTLVDRNDYHQFQPLLYQVASSQLPAEDIARPHRTIFRDHPSRRGRDRGRSTAADLADAQPRRWPTGGRCTGSHLVMAAGARPNFFGVPGAAEHAFPLYSVADAERLRLHLQRLLQRRWTAPAPATGQPRRRRRRRRSDRRRDRRRAGRADARPARRPAGSTAPGRITWSTAGTPCSASSRAKAHEYAHEQADRGGRRRPAGRRRHRGPRRPGRVRRRQRRRRPGPWSGAAASPAPPIAQGAGPAPAAADGSTSART